MTVMALLMAPMPAGARSAPQANSANGSTEFTVAMPAMRSQILRLNWARERHRNGIRTRAPRARRASTSGKAPKSPAATRMKRNEPPQMAPSSVSSSGVRQRAACPAPATGAVSERGFAMRAEFTVREVRRHPMLALRSSVERPAQVLDEILGRLNADRQAQQPVADAEARAILARQAGVRGRRRARQERVHTAQAWRDDREGHARGELVGAAGGPLELEAQHATEALEQALGALMPRMRLEPRIVHLRDGGVCGEELRDGKRAVILEAHAQGERLHAALEQEGRVRIEAAAEVIGAMADALDRGCASRHRPGDEIGVAVQVLGGAVQRYVKSGRNGQVVDRAGEGVVDDRYQAVCAREFNHRLKIGHLEQRIGHGLDVDGARVGAQLLGPRIAPVGIDEIVADAESSELAGEKVMRAAVQAVLRQQVIPGRQKAQERGRARGHAAGGDEGRLGALKRGDLLVQRQLARSEERR